MTRAAVAALAAFLAVPSLAAAQQPDSLPGMPRLRLRTDTLRLLPPAAFEGAGRLVLPRQSADVLASRWADSTRAHVAARAAARRMAYATGDTLVYARAIRLPLPPAVLVAPDEAPPQRVQTLGQYADLGIQLNALLETRFERRRNLHCTALDAMSFDNGCRGGFNPPRLDPQFNVRTGGLVGQRVHVNVDYDTQREFDASNNIQVHYEGLENEILRRVEVGNVTFAAPRSRFITGGIPANNFGVAARAQLGALDFGGLFAQQKGNVVKARIFTVGGQTVQPVDRVVADRDFETQRFFFVRNPRTFPGYPALDVLDFNAAGLPDSIRVTQLRLYRNRSSIGRPATETNLTGIQAIARRDDSPQRVGPVAWEVLIEGRDYYLDPSGLWFALMSRLDQDDHLAISYVTARGDTVGTFPATAQQGRSDTLELIHAPRSGADVPTFFYEMRNVYRVGGVDDITRTSVALELLVGGSARPPGASATFLSLLGLAIETDATTFDQHNRMFPRQRDPGNGTPLREYFAILPHLTPFADSTRLTPPFRVDSLYRTPGYLLRTQGPSPLWQLSLHYDARGGDSRGNLILGGYQIRAGSERVLVAGRQLQRNVEYTINYEVGQLTFVNPDSLFPRPTQVSVQFEENQAFAVAPTSIYGFQARYDLGDHGSVSGVAMFQQQRTTFTRPPLGFEPASNLVAGITGNFRFEPSRLTRLLDGLPFIRTEAPSFVTLDAEIATSRPSPNQVGVAYLETFEGEGGFFMPLSESQWEFGSRPGSARGADTVGIAPGGFDDGDAALLTWQNLIPPRVGNQPFQVTSRDIDSTIVLQGASTSYETVMWMAMHPDTIGGIPRPVDFQNRWLLPHTLGPRWRSITQPLSATGIDLSRTEFLEFWVLEDSVRTLRNLGASLVFDFGTVFEDAVDFQPTSFTVAGGDTTYAGRRRAGQGRLDTERDTLTASFNAQLNDTGILGDVTDSILDVNSGTMVTRLPVCQSPLGASSNLIIYSWGNSFGHCTRGNGLPDTEDLNNDQHLDTLIAASTEQVFRYVFKVGDPKYFVRTGGIIDGVINGQGAQWRLYRIPFRSDTIQVGVPDIRQIRALRLTTIVPSVAAESTVLFALARMRLVGAPWVKRAGAPIAGLGGQQGQPHGEVVASVVSTENFTDLGYVPPPGVIDEGQTVGSNITGSTQINERSLRLIASDVRTGERAEAYFRFPEGERNFLGYRELRVWARGRGANWDRNELTFFVKVGQDENNFYLYRQHLLTTTWLPEPVVQFREWHALRAQIEERFLSGLPPSGSAQCGGDSLAYVACNGPYFVQVRHPSISPPNLTRVQELAVGFVRDSGSALDSAELWVDDIRLSGVVNDAGYAGAITLGIAAADVMDLNVSASRRDGAFRQLGENPSYLGSNQLAVASTFRLERFGLEGLGITAPLTLRYDRASEDPYFLNATDVLASGLNGLRQPFARNIAWSLNVRRNRRGTRWWQKAITDNIGVSALWSSGSARTALATGTTRIADVRADYAVQPRELSFRYLPGFLRAALDALPGFLRHSDLVRGLRDGRFRYTPATIAFSSGMIATRADRASFRVPIETPLDTAIPVLSKTASLRSSAQLEMRPFRSMTAGATASWDRDLKDYGDTTSVGSLITQAGQRLAGLNVGFVRQRSMATRLAWQPPLASWIRPRFSWNSDFALSRDPNAALPERADGDTAGAFRIPTVFSNAVAIDMSGVFDVPRMLRGLLGDSSGLLRIVDRVTQFDVGRRIDRRSQYDRAGFDPGLGYMVGLGGRAGMRMQNGRFAISATDNRQDRASLALRLPLGLTVSSAFDERTGLSWFLRGTSQQLQRSVETRWPAGTARWVWNPGSASVRRFVQSVNASVGYTERNQVTQTPTIGEDADASGGLRSSQRTRSRPLTLTVSWPLRLITTVSMSNEHTRADRTGNLALGERKNLSADLRFSFRPPQEFLPIRSDVRTALRFQSVSNVMCIEITGLAQCVRIADSRQTEYNLTMDTDLPPNVVAGLAVGYVLTDDRHLNRKFSLFTLTASVRVTFQAGELR